MCVQKYLVTSPRVLYLEKLSLAICGVFTYLQATSPFYGPRLKRAGDLLARMVPGATFAKAWRPKPAASILTKLYYRRGQTTQGWLSDALQARITCDTKESAESVVEFFSNVLSKQAEAALEDQRSVLSSPPTAADIMNYDISGLLDEDSEKPIDAIATFCEEAMTPEGKCFVLCSTLTFSLCVSPCACSQFQVTSIGQQICIAQGLPCMKQLSVQ